MRREHLVAAPTIVRAAVATPRSPARLALHRFLHRPVAVAGLAVIVLFIGVAVLAPLIAPYDPIATSWTVIRKAPSLAHWMGTDENGRDVLSRVVFGARASLLAGVVVGADRGRRRRAGGLAAGFAQGWIDIVLSRIVDAMLACPFLILAIALAAFLGPDLTNAMIAIGVSTAPRFMRVTRAATLDASSNEYVEAARAIGNPGWRVAVRHVLPNIVPPVHGAGDAGDRRGDHRRGEPVVSWLGQQPPAPSWGSMLNSAQRFLSQAPWLAVFPGPGDLPRGAVVQSGGRRTARCAGSAGPIIRRLTRPDAARCPGTPLPGLGQPMSAGAVAQQGDVAERWCAVGLLAARHIGHGSDDVAVGIARPGPRHVDNADRGRPR